MSFVRVARNVVQQKEAFATSRKKGDQGALLDIIRASTQAGGARPGRDRGFQLENGRSTERAN
ncbi:MAG: hypothetical protein IPH00_11710 [Flavobacteriales bacterium]|nr:hypothetical protein [Flavobacteriales bacterium]